MLLPEHYDDGGISGGTLERPALQQLLVDVDEGRIDQIVVYKVDRLTRSLTDFAKLVDKLDGAGASFVSVTQSFNTATSMGTVDTERPSQLRTVRTRSNGRTHTGQDRRVEEEGTLDGR